MGNRGTSRNGGKEEVAKFIKVCSGKWWNVNRVVKLNKKMEAIEMKYKGFIKEYGEIRRAYT